MGVEVIRVVRGWRVFIGLVGFRRRALKGSRIDYYRIRAICS